MGSADKQSFGAGAGSPVSSTDGRKRARGALPAGGGVVDVHRVDANQAGVVFHEPAGARLGEVGASRA
jgi:hypothetical protein